MTDRYAVVGNPISHSQSPLIHAEFARQTSQKLTYERLLAPLDGFASTVQQLSAKAVKGSILRFRLSSRHGRWQHN